MTVKELIEQLGSYDPETEVHFSYNYGDHWRTEVAPRVSDVREECLKWSAYHSMPIVDDEGESELVVVLS
jgi:hypothetical protein